MRSPVLALGLLVCYPCNVPLGAISMQSMHQAFHVTAKAAVGLLFTLGCVVAVAQVSPGVCGSLRTSYGPFDYRSSHYRAAPGDSMSHADKLNIVERVHFTFDVEFASKGSTGSLPGPDLEYTLKVFPNHHRALVAVIRLWERSGIPTPPGFTRPAECYFERAIRFQTSDTVSRLIYATFLIKASRTSEAVMQLEAADRDAQDNAFSQYNIGLLYVDAKKYDEALLHAHRAMALGLERPELMRRLEAVGKWREPDAAKPP